MVILVRSFDALAKLIQAGMFTWYVVRGKKPRKVYNHAEIYVNGMVSGALARGITNRSYKKAFEDGKKRELLFYEMNLNEDQTDDLYEFCLDRGGVPYEYMNFGWHAVRIFSVFFTGTDVWLGRKRKKAKKRTYCIEHGADCVKVKFPKSIKRPWRINPVEFKKYCDEHFKLMIRND